MRALPSESCIYKMCGETICTDHVLVSRERVGLPSRPSSRTLLRHLSPLTSHSRFIINRQSSSSPTAVKSSMLENVEQAPPDLVLGITEAFKVGCFIALFRTYSHPRSHS